MILALAFASFARLRCRMAYCVRVRSTAAAFRLSYDAFIRASTGADTDSWSSVNSGSPSRSQCGSSRYVFHSGLRLGMLADPRSITLASNFLHQWLDMKRLNDIVPDNDVFPYASGRSDPRPEFREELTLFADSIFRENHSVVDLLKANYTFLNERLALHYGITDVKGDRFRRVELKNSVRWGLLGKGAVLMAAAYPNRTSPVLRGSFILKYLQGVPPALPPPNVPTLDEKDIGTTRALTVREMMAKHRASPTWLPPPAASTRTCPPRVS